MNAGVSQGPSTPIFVVGFQRSGTTLLQSMLGAHPAIAAPPETYFVLRIAALRDYYGDLSDDDNLRRVLHDTIHPPLPLLAGLGLDEDRLFEIARTRPRDYTTVLDVMMEEIARRWGRRRWSDKSPGQPAHAVLALFPHAQVVHIVRDPRDVIASSLETPWTSGSARQIARQWRHFTLACLRAGLESGPRRYLMVRYEDLTREPEVVLRRICHFLDETFHPDMLDPEARRQAGTVTTAARALAGPRVEPGHCRSSRSIPRVLSPWQRASVASVVRGELAALGYEPARSRTVAVGAVVKRGPSRRGRPGHRPTRPAATRLHAGAALRGGSTLPPAQPPSDRGRRTRLHVAEQLHLLLDPIELLGRDRVRRLLRMDQAGDGSGVGRVVDRGPQRRRGHRFLDAARRCEGASSRGSAVKS